ncbi:carboxy methyl transferase for protein phosphatase 2A [Microsporum audouinii]
MSAPHIPNLNTLRRGGGRGRGRSRAGYHGAGHGAAISNDKVVQQTDNDASVSRLSAVEQGYLHDPFASIFASETAEARRYPIINRGTYVRTTSIDKLVSRFLRADERKKQIVSLGAGSDTRAFRLLSENPALELIYHELDFAENTTSKITKILSSPLLLDALRITGREEVTTSPNGDAFHSEYYHIHPIDLRTLTASSTSGPSRAHLQEIDIDIPTLLISECCLVYLSPVDAVNVVSYFTNNLFSLEGRPSTPLALIIYEPIRPDDPFGRTMVSNLAARGIQLQTLHRYATLQAQRERLQGHGFSSGQGVADIDYIWEKWIGEDEKSRVAGLEMLDEIEEWQLLARHYCVAWGWRDNQSTAGSQEENLPTDELFHGWREFPSQ